MSASALSAAAALKSARAAGIELRLDGDDLVLAAPVPPPDAVVDMLSRNKPGVVALLRPRRDGRSAEDWQIIFDRFDQNSAWYQEPAPSVSLPFCLSAPAQLIRDQGRQHDRSVSDDQRIRVLENIPRTHGIGEVQRLDGVTKLRSARLLACFSLRVTQMPSVLQQGSGAGLPAIRFDANIALLVEGESSGRLYMLIDGEIEVLRGHTRVMVANQPGAIFGEMSVLLGIPHTATVKTVVPSTVYVIDDAEAFLHAHPEIAFVVARLLAQRLSAATNYLVDLKQQFEGRGDHMEMVGDVLESLIHQQNREFVPGSDRQPDHAT